MIFHHRSANADHFSIDHQVLLIYGAMALVTDCVVPWQQVLTMTDANGTLVKWAYRCSS